MKTRKVSKSRKSKSRKSKLLPHQTSKATYVIYGSSMCPYCRGAKELVEQKNVSHKYIELPMYGPLSHSNIHTTLHKYIGNHHTIPIIFKDGKFIGGLDVLETHLA